MFAWKIGKVLWFLTLVKQKREASNTKEQAMIIRVNKKQQEFSWFTSTSNQKVFELNNDITERIMATLFLVCTAILVYTFLMMF